MPANPADLMSEIYEFFRVLYPESSPQAFLVFEPAGLPVNPADFLFNNTACPPLGVEWVSTLANRAITFNDGNLQHGSTVVDSFVDLLVNGCQADSADALTLLGEEKEAALVQTGIKQASLSGIPDDDYHPVISSPVNWFDATASGNWTSYQSGQPPQSATSPPVGTPVPPPISWKVGPPRRPPVPIHIGGGTGSGGGSGSLPAHGPGHMMPMMVAGAATPAVIAPVMVERPIILPPGEPRALALVAPERIAALNATLAVSAADNKATTQQDVASANLSLRCQYCTVSLSWPWLPESFLLTRNWHLPGYQQAAFSNGTGSADPGMMPVIPSAFLVVRDLAITAQWTGSDVANLQSAAGFGPFSLAGSSFDATTGELLCPGLQIVGWFCSALPVLPPSADPALPAAAGQTAGVPAGTAALANAAAQ